MDAASSIDFEGQNGTSCDRRISRAARTILHRHLSKLVALRNGDSSNKNDDITVWDLLDETLPAPHLHSNSDRCALIPFKDSLKEDEEHTLQLPAQLNARVYPTTTLKARRKSSSQRPEAWYQCTYCGKIFMTRYYLDWHMNNQHRQINSDESDGLICPATSWCHILGGKRACHEMALKLEPYYDRGSGGWGADSSFIQHRLAKEAHAIPCTKYTIIESQLACHEMLELCGWKQDDRDEAASSTRVTGSMVHHQICDSLQCPDRILHHVLGGLHVDSWLEDWHIKWTSETNHHHIGMAGVLVVAGLLLWYLSSIWKYSYGVWNRVSTTDDGLRERQRRRQRDISGRRLLQKSKPTSSSWMAIPWKATTSNSRSRQKLE